MGSHDYALRMNVKWVERKEVASLKLKLLPSKNKNKKLGRDGAKKPLCRYLSRLKFLIEQKEKEKKEKRLLLIQSVLLDLCVYAKYWLHHFKWRNSLSSTSRFVLFFKWFIFWNQSLIENGFMCNTKPLHWHNISSLPLSTYYNYKCY